MTDNDDILAVMRQMRDELREARESLDFQMLATESAADAEAHRSVSSALSHVQTVEALLDRLEEALR